jgi:hypothetical protein
VKKVLETLKVLLWGILGVVIIGLYAIVTVAIGITIAFYGAIMEIWTND